MPAIKEVLVATPNALLNSRASLAAAKLVLEARQSWSAWSRCLGDRPLVRKKLRLFETNDAAASLRK